MQNPQAFTQESFKRMSNQLQNLTPQVNDLAVGISNIVALVGATGVGKSTLTSYLKDAKLTFDKYGGGKYQINHVNIGTDLPKIGHENQSCTTIPGVYKDQDKAYVDLAGWFDTRAPEQEILNSISNSLIFTPSKRVKILIVIQVQELNALRGGLLVQIANRLIQFFQDDFSKMINSIILVISKVNINQWSMKDVETNIVKICQKNQNLMHHTKFLLNSLIQNERIVLFPRPDQITNHISIIKDKLKIVRPTILSHKGRITLSQKAINVIGQCVNFLNQNLQQLGKSFASDIQKSYKYKNFSKGSEVNQVLNDIKTSANILQSQFQKFQDYQKQSQLLKQFGQKVHVSQKVSDKMKQTFVMIQFYTNLNRNIKLDYSFINIISGKLKQVISSLQVIRIGLTSEEERKEMQVKFNASLKEREEQNKKQLKRIQDANKASQKNLSTLLANQQKMYQQEMKNRKAQKQNMERQIRQLRNRPVQQSSGGRGGGCNLI